MLLRTRSGLLPLNCLIVCLTMMGCGPSFVKAKGKVLRDGEPLRLNKGERLEVSFLPFADGVKTPGDSFPANIDRQLNTFELPGKLGKGIPPGRYRIAIRVMRGESDLLKDAFRFDKSSIIRDVTSTDEIVIDIAKPSG